VLTTSRDKLWSWVSGGKKLTVDIERKVNDKEADVKEAKNSLFFRVVYIV
jgi:hypothetical protein